MEVSPGDGWSLLRSLYHILFADEIFRWLHGMAYDRSPTYPKGLQSWKKVNDPNLKQAYHIKAKI